MKPREKGWLKEYLDFRKDLLGELTSEKRHSTHPEHSLYRIIQPTGLMYGQSVLTIEHPDAHQWDEKDRMKILLAESLISSSLLFNDKPVRNPEELSQLMLKTLESIAGFYNNVFPELATSSKTLFGRKKTSLELAERILDKRIEKTGDFTGSFWTHFFHNSLLFLDVFIFGQWIHTNADRIVSDFFKYEREELRFSIIKIIASASHANSSIEFEERKLLEFFLRSSGLSAERKKEAMEIFEKGVDVESINLPTNNSWILKKFFLEMAILTLWADKKVEERETLYLKRLCEYLDFTADDLENSSIAIEGFVLEHWEELGYLQNKQDYNQVSERYMERLARLTENNKARIVNEVKESKKLMELLGKAKSSTLDESEKQQIHEMMLMVLKTIPTFAIISLPQRFLTLPMLLKILPPNIFAESLKS